MEAILVASGVSSSREALWCRGVGVEKGVGPILGMTIRDDGEDGSPEQGTN